MKERNKENVFETNTKTIKVNVEMCYWNLATVIAICTYFKFSSSGDLFLDNSSSLFHESSFHHFLQQGVPKQRLNPLSQK